MRPLPALWVVTWSAVGLTYGLTHYRLNVSASAPYGVYLRQPVGELRRGQYVELSPLGPWQREAIRLQVVPNGWVPLLKPIAGVPGDRVCLQLDRLWVNGTSYGSLAEHVPHAFEGCQVVAQETVFVASMVEGSYDSRYFGAVPMHGLRAVMIPRWTW